MSHSEMKMVDVIREKYDYMFWSERELVAAAETVSDEGKYREQNISAGSIHKLLVHMMAAQMMWLGRWEQKPLSKFPSVDEYPTFAALKEHWADVHRRLQAFLEKQTGESVFAPLTFKFRDGVATSEVWKMMLHVADHSTYHRGQVNSMIKLAGGKATDAAYFLYRRRVCGDT